MSPDRGNRASVVGMVQPSDEHRRPAGPDPLWADAWEIDFTSGPGDRSGGQVDLPSVGGYVRLSLLPNQGIAWWWTSLLTPRLVAVRDHEVPLPRGAGLEVRADGLWGELVCETPLEHWGVGLEAFGIAYDDPADAWGDEWGERIPVGLDLEWEATAEPGDLPAAGPDPRPGGVTYRQPGRVHGEILVGPDQRIPFEGTGFRSRSSGVLDWWSGPLPRRLAWIDGQGQGRLEDLDSRSRTVLGSAPLLVTAPSVKPARLARELCWVEGDGGGLGWAEA
jgi:hypothetical protein